MQACTLRVPGRAHSKRRMSITKVKRERERENAAHLKERAESFVLRVVRIRVCSTRYRHSVGEGERKRVAAA